MTRGFPTVEEVVAIHADQIAQFGGAMGLRDMGALESALLRPQMGYYDGPIEEAAALMESLAMNHPFVDGNKRVAFFTTDAFLRMNGTFIDCDSEDRPTPTSCGSSRPTHSASPSSARGSCQCSFSLGERSLHTRTRERRRELHGL